ncbi:oligosaccharide flippase family protein [Arthrobacter citreus]|uniref:Oligosaccharide flippase family protein n=1 Tax=Arthrobacter citreus TaxID=1670 RepID=A0ABZ2ZR55_9MICC
MKKQFSALLISRGLSSLIQAVSLLLLVRWAGAEAFGLIAVITSIAAVLYALSDWGAAVHVPRSRAKELHALVAGGLVVSVIGNSAAAVMLTTGVAGAVILSGWNIWLVLIPIALAAEQFTEAGLTVSVADRVKSVVFVNLLVRRLSMLATFVGTYYVTYDAVLSYAFGCVVSAICGVTHVALDLRVRLRGMEKPQVRLGLWKEFSPFVLENISSSSRNLDTTIVAALTSVQATGYYSAAFRLTKPLNQIGGAATAVLVPHASRSSAREVKRAGTKLCVVGLLGIVVALLGGLFAEQIVVLFFGSDFVVAAPVFAWALVSIAPVCLAPSLGALLQGQGYQKFVAVNGLVFACITLAGVFIGTAAFGISGAAAALALSYILKSLVLAIRIGKLRTTDNSMVEHVDSRNASTAFKAE